MLVQSARRVTHHWACTRLMFHGAMSFMLLLVPPKLGPRQLSPSIAMPAECECVSRICCRR